MIELAQGQFPINPFVHNAPFLYPLRTSENLMVLRCFQRVEKGCIGNKWAKKSFPWNLNEATVNTKFKSEQSVSKEKLLIAEDIQLIWSANFTIMDLRFSKNHYFVTAVLVKCYNKVALTKKEN